LEGLQCILENIPQYLLKSDDYFPLPDVVPPRAKEVAIVGQNLCTWLWLEDHRYNRAVGELRTLLSRNSIERIILTMMPPKALHEIHPEAADDMRSRSLPGLIRLNNDFPDVKKRIQVLFHPAATLSLVAVDWTTPKRAFALITLKFQRTAKVDGRLVLLLNETEFEGESFARMLTDPEANVAPLSEAAALLERLLEQVIPSSLPVGTNKGLSENARATIHEPMQPGLTEEGKQLLLEASEDKSGKIFCSRYGDGTHIKTNEKEFGQPGNPRVEAKWKSALNELFEHGLIEDRGHKGEVFAVTDRGYDLADRLRSQ